MTVRSLWPRLTRPENVLKAIDDMMAEFGDTEELLLMWAGDWFQIEIELNREQPKGYQPQWQLQEPQMSWRIGRYRGHPIVRGSRNGERRFYVVDPSSWGTLVRGQFEGDQDIRVEINTVSEERANELLELNPDYFPDEPDFGIETAEAPIHGADENRDQGRVQGQRPI